MIRLPEGGAETALADEIADLQQIDVMRRALAALEHAFPSPWLRGVSEELALRDGDHAEVWRSAQLEGDRSAAALARHASAAVAVGEPLRALGILGRVGIAGGLLMSAGPPSADLRAAKLTALANPARARRMAFSVWQQALQSGDLRLAAEASMLRSVTDSPDVLPSEGATMVRRAEDFYLHTGLRAGSYVARARVWSVHTAAGMPSVRACAAALADHALLQVDCEVNALRSLWAGHQHAGALAVVRNLQARREVGDNPVTLLAFAVVAAPILESAGDAAAAERLLRAAVAGGAGGLQSTAANVQLAGLLRRSGRTAEAEGLVQALGQSTSGAARGWLDLESAMLRLQYGDGEGANLLLQQIRSNTADAGLLAAVAVLGLESGSDGEHYRFVGGASPALSAAWEGRVRHRRGDLEGAARALGLAARFAADDLAAVAEPGARLSLRFAWQGVFEEWAGILLQLGRAGEALAAVELARTAGEVGSQRTVAHLVEHIGDQTGVLFLADVGGATWAWFGTANGWQAMPLRERLAAMGAQSVLLQQAAMGDSLAVWDLVARLLSNALVLPLVQAGWLDSIEKLVVVGGDGLQAAPIDALPWPGRDGDAVLDHLAVSRAISLLHLDRLLHQPPRRGGRSLLVAPYVGPSADAEVRAARSGLPGHALRGEQATETALRRHLLGASVVHLAAHATPVARDWSKGGLQLHPGRQFDGLLTWNEIQSLPVSGAHIVLLGCETAASRRSEQSRVEPGSSLAEAFGRAGAHSVVSWLWPLREAEAAEFAVAYYGAGGPQRGLPAMVAAKRELRSRHPDEPRRWAGAVWLGLPDPIGR